MTNRFVNPIIKYTTSTLKTMPGAELYFYTTGTSTPKVTYQDFNGTIPHAHPVVALSDGHFPPIFLNGTYRGELKYLGITQPGWPVDDIGATNAPAPLDNWISGFSYSIGQLVTAPNGLRYQSIQNNNLNNEPSASPLWWSQVFLGGNVDSWAQLDIAARSGPGPKADAKDAILYSMDLAQPSALSFVRGNADGTFSNRTPAQVKSDLGLLEVATFADILNTPLSIGQVFNLRCHTSGTIGSGQFIGVGGTVTSDGGTQINSSTGGVYAKRINYSKLSVEMFGAGGNSVRASAPDESVLLQNAINAAQLSSTTNILVFPALYYKTSVTLNITKPIFLEGVRPAGGSFPGGVAAIIGTELYGTMTGSPVTFWQNVNMSHGASNMTFSANGTATYSMHHDSCVYGRFVNCWFRDSMVFPFYGDARTGTHSWNTFEGCRFTSGYISTSTAAFALGGYKTGYNSCHNTFINTTIEHAGDSHGMLLGFCDNNSFYGIYTNRGTATYGGAPASTGYGVTYTPSVDVYAYGNTFYGLQSGNGGYYEPPGSYGGVYQIATIYGYALDNVEPTPILAAFNGYYGTVVFYNSGDSLLQKTVGVNMTVPAVYPIDARARTTGSRGTIARFGQAQTFGGYDDIGFQFQGAHLNTTGTIIADNGVAGSGSASGVRWEGSTITFYSMPGLTSGAGVTVTDSIKAFSVTQSAGGAWTYGFCGATPSVRDAGYGTPTNTAKIVSFNAATVTLPQTAGILGALIIELKSKGLIGA